MLSCSIVPCPARWYVPSPPTPRFSTSASVGKGWKGEELLRFHSSRMGWVWDGGETVSIWIYKTMRFGTAVWAQVLPSYQR